MKHVITALVENQPGVLARVVGLISGRGYNIESLCVGPTQDPSMSRITLQVPGDDRVLEQVTKQLNKLIDVIKVTDLTKEPFVNCELVLIKVKASRDNRREIIEIADVFGAQVVAMHAHHLIIQVVADGKRVASFIDMLKPFQITDMSRSGVVAMAKE
jgi:acetolactate synthase-1/3 small subunit